jgi:hypothetical protein
MTTNPVTAQIQVKKEEGETTEVLRTENKVIDPTPSASNGEIGFNVSMRVPEVFGRYSSMEVGLFLKGPGDPNKFEEFVSKYLDRAVNFQRGIINEVLVKQGQRPYFGDGDETEKAR